MLSDQILIEKASLNQVLLLEEALSNENRDYINSIYRYPDFMRLVECSFISFIISESCPETTNPSNEAKTRKIIGLAVFDIEPVNSLFQSQNYYTEIQKIGIKVDSFNSLFLSFYFAADFTKEKYAETFISLAKIVVNENPQIEQILYYSDEKESQLAKDSSFIDFLKNNRIWQQMNSFFIFSMKSITPTLFFRKAREEDQDNLSKVSEGQTHLLAEHYGKFFLAEIISSQGNDKLCLVAETEEKQAIGFAVISTDINFDIISDNFDLKDFNYFTKSDYFEGCEYRKGQLSEVESLQKQLHNKKYLKELEYYKITCSKNWLTLDLQEYCSNNKAAFLAEFQQILGDVEKQKLINKNIMKRKLEKLLKTHTIAKPNEIWSKELDVNVTTCIMSTSDLLLDALRYFDLPTNYLDGEGHWSFWIKRKQDEKNEEAKQKGILGKKKNKTKKKKADEGKDNQLVTPPWFDVEPFYMALQSYINSNQQVRQTVCLSIENLKQKIANLFYDLNGEFLDGRIVDLADILDIIATEELPNLPENLQMLIPYILVCFGNLQFDVEKVVVNETSKGKSGKPKEKTNEKILKKISFHELFECIDRIKKIDYIFTKKFAYLKEVENKIVTEFDEQAKRIIDFNSKKFEAEKYLHEYSKIELNSDVGSGIFLKNIPNEMKNAICCNIFFIDKSYERCSSEFLQAIFEYYENYDYLILTLPHKTPEFQFLKSFIRAKAKKNTNFPHGLYVFYKANLLNKFANVQIIKSKDLNLVSSSKTSSSIQKTTQMEFSVVLNIPNFPTSQIGKVIAQKSINMQHLKQFYDVSEVLFIESYKKVEVLELLEFDLHFIFQKLRPFILRELLRLTNSKVLVRNQENKNLALVAEYFYCIKSLGVFRFNINPIESAFSQKKIVNRYAVEFENTSAPFKSDNSNLKASESFRLPNNMSLTTLRMLFNDREKITSRVIVLGASSCAESFLETLLNHPKFHFTSIFLISETLDWESQIIQTKPLKLEKLDSKIQKENLLERVSVIVGHLFYLDRKIKTVSIQTHSGKEFLLEYDFLIFANGLEEKTYEILCDKKNFKEKIKKPGHIIAVDKLNSYLSETICSNQKISQFTYLHKKTPQTDDLLKTFKNHQEKSGQQFFKSDENEQYKYISLFNRKNLSEYTDIREILNNDDKIQHAFKERQHIFSKISSNKIVHPVVLYGFSIEILIVLQQLIERWNVKPENIILIIPIDLALYDKETPQNYGMSNESKLEFIEKLIETPIGLNNKRVREFYFSLLRNEGITIYLNFEISDFSFTENTLILKNLSPIKVDTKPGKKGKNYKTNANNTEVSNVIIASKTNLGNQGEKSQCINESAANSEDSEETFDYSLLITGHIFDISYKIFRTIQDNGLVYNGRLIVQSNYQTIDENIFAAGRICEFSQRYKSVALGKSLRMDKYNQTEIGKALASSFVSKICGDKHKEELESFHEPIGMNAKLFLGFYVLEIEFSYNGKIELDQVLTYEASDLLDEKSKPEYISLGFNKELILKRIFYFGKRELNLAIFKNLIGLHKNFFNNMFEHAQKGFVTSFVDYINEGWAKAILHPMFLSFKKLMDKICSSQKVVEGSDQLNHQFVLKKLVEENLMDFVSDNKELLDFYFIPDFKRKLD